MATAAVALTGEYGNMCTLGLALGKERSDRGNAHRRICERVKEDD
jgi:hypothetical protein